MERRHQPRPGLCEFQAGQPTAGHTCPRKVPAVTTLALPYNATEAPGSWPQQSGEAFELSQNWLEALLPSHRWVCWEIATSGHIKHWEGTPGFLRELTICSQIMYPTWLPEELCTMLSARPKKCKTLYHSFTQAPVGTGSDRAASSLLAQLRQKKAEAMGKSSKFHWHLTL